MSPRGVFGPSRVDGLDRLVVQPAEHPFDEGRRDDRASKVGYFDLGPALGVALEIIELNIAGEALFDLVESCVMPI